MPHTTKNIRELAKIVGISVRSVETIIHDELGFSNVNAHWIPKLLSDKQKKRRVKISTHCLDRSEREGDP
jgi:hypothetical protein